ncbi:epoxyqueuosine reductase [archaeon]|nr:epoxyqueuosine reductase [archaeon]
MRDVLNVTLVAQRKLYESINTTLNADGADLVGIYYSSELDAEIGYPWVKSVVIYGIGVEDEALLLNAKLRKWSERRQFVDILLDYIGNRLGMELTEMGVKVKVLSAALPELDLRRLAVDAGLGFYGKNSLVITEEFGPRVRFGGVLLSVPLKHFPIEINENPCFHCNECVKACPAGALNHGYNLMACDEYNSRLNKHKKCTMCTDVCPVGKE